MKDEFSRKLQATSDVQEARFLPFVNSTYPVLIIQAYIHQIGMAMPMLYTKFYTNIVHTELGYGQT